MSAAAPTRVVLVGGTSEIGLATVRRLAQTGPVAAALLGRDRDRVRAAGDELAQAGVPDASVHVLAEHDPEACGQAVQAAFAALGEADVVILAVGRLGHRAGLDADPRDAAEVMRVTFTLSGLLMLHCLRALRAQGSGTLVVLSSVAGERVRASNAVYGAAKAGLDGLAAGLGDAVAGDGPTHPRVLVVRPGFVTSRMTAGLPRPPLACTPDAVARATVRALDGRADVIWVPGVLRWVFAVLRLAPRPLWRRLPL